MKCIVKGGMIIDFLCDWLKTVNQKVKAFLSVKPIEPCEFTWPDLDVSIMHM